MLAHVAAPNRRMAVALSTLVILAALVHGAQGAEAPAPCTDRPGLAAFLKARFMEEPAAIGLGNDGRLLEVFSTANGVTWTLVATTPQGVSCVLGTGRTWLQHMPPIPGREASWRP